MAKLAKTAIRREGQLDADAKNYTKVIKAVRNPKNGAYAFKEKMVHKDLVDEYLAEK